MGIPLYSIQPCESYLCEEAVEFFQKCPDKLFDYEDPIIIFYYQGREFRYFVTEGHHRLLVCHRLKITDVPVEPRKDYDKRD